MFAKYLLLLSAIFAVSSAESGFAKSTYQENPSSYYRQGRQTGYSYYPSSYYRGGGGYNNYQPSYNTGGSFGYNNHNGYQNPNYYYQQQSWYPSYQQTTGYRYNNYNSYNYPRYNSGFGSGYQYQPSPAYGVIPQPVRTEYGYAK